MAISRCSIPLNSAARRVLKSCVAATVSAAAASASASPRPAPHHITSHHITSLLDHRARATYAPALHHTLFVCATPIYFARGVCAAYVLRMACVLRAACVLMAGDFYTVVLRPRGVQLTCVLADVYKVHPPRCPSPRRAHDRTGQATDTTAHAVR